MGSEMRFKPVLRGQILTDYSYTWDTTYTKLLLEDDLRPATRLTTTTGLTNTEDTWSDTTVDFILQDNYRYRTRLDGIVRGNVKFHIVATGGATSGVVQSVQYTPSLITKTSAGAVTTLATGNTSTSVSVSAGASPAVTTLDVDVPFVFDINNKQIPETQKLCLRLLIQCKYTTPNHDGSGSVNYLTALNTDDIFVVLPTVP